jgi:hypothetical protein
MSAIRAARRHASVLVAPGLLALALLALAGCETTAERSAQLERKAKHVKLSSTGLSIAKPSKSVRVLGTSLVRDSEGAAAIVTLHNGSAHALREVPLAITVEDARGHVTYTNAAAGLERALASVPSLAAHATVTWVDDQLPGAGAPTRVSASVGEAPAVAGALPRVSISGARLAQEPGGAVAQGTVTNRSNVDQRALVVFALVRRGARAVAAGRAILPDLPAGASERFQVDFIGEAAGGRLQLLAPPTTFG